ncbi:MAG: HAMP domain-containing histidine kinase [Ktedonobacterales bacterium]|nr:HAMP domain-containing histidine kinase [Ktedonobacterales bacterium]
MDQIIVLGSVAVAGIALAVAMALIHGQRERRSQTTPATNPPRASTKIAAITPPPTRTTATTRIVGPLVLPTTPDDEMDWLAQAADELHTPLATLRDQVRFLRVHVNDASRTALITVAERLVYQVEQLDSLIEAWSATARHTGPQRIVTARPVELVALTRLLAQRLAAPNTPPSMVVAPAALWVLMDPQAIERVLTITLTNAYRAMPTGEIETVLHQVALRDRQAICVAVADRRRGALAPDQDVWEALELDLARVLLEDYSGWLERAPRGGGGVVTTIWLPATLLIRLPGHDSLPTFTRLAKTA